MRLIIRTFFHYAKGAVAVCRFVNLHRSGTRTISSRSKLTAKTMSSIFLYNDKGSEEDCRRFFYESLLDTVDPNFHCVQFISAGEIIEGGWTSKAKVLCFGGGYDLGFLESLGARGIRTIRDYVLNGGKYLGICAGAYFACNYIEFDKEGPLEVVGQRDLEFYPGKCIGPAFPGFVYNSKQGVHAVPLSYLNSMTLNAYMNGGGYFLPDPVCTNRESVEVLGTYDSLEDSPAAVVKCKVGSGCAILSGVHLEFQAHDLDKEDVYLHKWMPYLLESERKRKLAFQNILMQLGLKLRDPMCVTEAIL